MKDKTKESNNKNLSLQKRNMVAMATLLVFGMIVAVATILVSFLIIGVYAKQRSLTTTIITVILLTTLLAGLLTIRFYANDDVINVPSKILLTVKILTILFILFIIGITAILIYSNKLYGEQDILINTNRNKLMTLKWVIFSISIISLSIVTTSLGLILYYTLHHNSGVSYRVIMEEKQKEIEMEFAQGELQTIVDEEVKIENKKEVEQ